MPTSKGSGRDADQRGWTRAKGPRTAFRRFMPGEMSMQYHSTSSQLPEYGGTGKQDEADCP